MDDGELHDFLAAYAEVCTEAGIDQLPVADLAALAEALPAGNVNAAAARH